MRQKGDEEGLVKRKKRVLERKMVREGDKKG
jgi:hypothetical protein